MKLKKPFENKVIKLTNGMEMDFETVKTNAPIDFIISTLYLQQNDHKMRDCKQKAYYEYIIEAGYYCDIVDSSEMNTDKYQSVDYEFDICDYYIGN